MTAFSKWFKSVSKELVDDFYGELSNLPRSRRVLEMLSDEELVHLTARRNTHLYRLATESQSSDEREAAARRLGRVHALIGVERDELVIARGLLMSAINRRMAADGCHESGVNDFANLLTEDLAWQMQSYQDLDQKRQVTLQRLTEAVWSARTYTWCIDRVVAILTEHSAIAGCAIGRPDDQGVFRFEAAASSGMDTYFAEMLDGGYSKIVVHADQPGGQGPVGRAWRSQQIERIVNFSTDPQAAPWRAAALSKGLRSCIAVPLGAHGRQPVAVMLAYSRYPGGFISQQQHAFFGMLQTLIGNRLNRFDEVAGMRAAVSFTARNRFAALVRSDALLTYYQPILDLHTWRIAKVEALTPLQEDEQVLAPGLFLDALEGDDLLEVFTRSLDRALRERMSWLAQGIDLEISINLPPAAFGDIRYYDGTVAALDRYACPARCLTLEVLENESVSMSFGRQTLLDQFQTLGVKLAQDDLGAGQSGLSRLRTLPFDLIKIDRDMVTIDERDPLPAMRFILQLTRLGHALGKRVIAEGVESPDWLSALSVLGVDMAQGYALAKPLPEPALIAWLRQWAVDQGGATRCASVMTRVARLLIWGDRLTINYEATGEMGEAERRAALSAWVSTDGIGIDTGSETEADALQRLIDTVFADGPGSGAFARAMDDLVRVMVDERSSASVGAR